MQMFSHPLTLLHKHDTWASFLNTQFNFRNFLMFFLTFLSFPLSLFPTFSLSLFLHFPCSLHVSCFLHMRVVFASALTGVGTAMGPQVPDWAPLFIYSERFVFLFGFPRVDRLVSLLGWDTIEACCRVRTIEAWYKVMRRSAECGLLRRDIKWWDVLQSGKACCSVEVCCWVLRRATLVPHYTVY